MSITVDGSIQVYSGLKLGDMAALFVLGLNLVVGKVVRITRTLKVSTSFPVLYLDKDFVKLPGLTEEAVNVFDGVLDIASESLPQTYSVLTLYICCNAKKCVISIQFYSHLFD